MQPGERISANVQLQKLLGRGGMGSIWVAYHEGLGTQVAVKTMAADVSREPELVARFRREAAAAAQLKSPHVAQVFDHGVTPSGTPYIVMELLEGEDLAKRIERKGPLPLEVVADVVTQVSKALHRAHQANVVHRDIKADNVFLIDQDGDLLVKVLDFGIAKVELPSESAMTATQGTFGTPLYMSPEQLMSAKHVDAQADLWSLAVLAYYALTGQFPYSGPTVGAISVAVHKGAFVPPSHPRPGLSPAVDRWFLKAFQSSMLHRFSSAKEMAEALRKALQGSSSDANVGISAVSAANDFESMPTVDTRDDLGASQGASAPFVGATLGGASIPGLSKHPRRTTVLVGVGLFVGMAAAFFSLRFGSGAKGPVKEPESGASASASVSASVVVVPSAEDERPGQGSASSSATASDSSRVGASASVSPQASASATGAANATTAASATMAPTPTTAPTVVAAGSKPQTTASPPISTKPNPSGKPSQTTPVAAPKKDDIGF